MLQIFAQNINPMKTNWIYVVGLLLMGTHLSAQFDSEKDMAYEHWQKVEGLYKINKKWDLIAGVEARWETDPSDLRQIYGEIEPSYEVLDWMSVAVGYRFITDLDRHRNRFYFQMNPTYEINKRWEVDARVRYEINERAGEYEPRLRLKINPEYSRKKHKVFASAEVYLRELQEEEKWRYALGYRYRLNKRQDIGLRLIYDIEERDEMAAVALKFSHEF